MLANLCQVRAHVFSVYIILLLRKNSDCVWLANISSYSPRANLRPETKPLVTAPNWGQTKLVTYATETVGQWNIC